MEVNGQCHTLSLSLLDCKLWALVLCLCPCLLPRPESGESISFCQAVPVGASISARPERLDLHWSFRGVSASADGPGHSTHLSAQHSHRGQTCYQPEKLRYLHWNKVLHMNCAYDICLKRCRPTRVGSVSHIKSRKSYVNQLNGNSNRKLLFLHDVKSKTAA